MNAGGTQQVVRIAQVLGVIFVAAYVAVVQWATTLSETAAWRGLLVAPVLVLLGLHLIVRATRNDGHALRRLLMAAFLLKCLATVARWALTGNADASAYDDEGARLALSYQRGDFGADLGRDFIGTGFIRALTGALYAVTGPSIVVGYAFYSFLGFWGLYYFYRAFEAGMPHGDHRRYALLVLLLPSTLFWSSGLGKDAWMTFGLGLAAFGSARLLSHRSGWFLPIVAGLLATGVVRPPITAAFVAGLAAAVAIRRSLKGADALAPLKRVAHVGVVLALAVFVVGRASEFLRIDEVSSGEVEKATAFTVQQTSQGGSAFHADPVTSPLDMPGAILTVLFRPFLIEADSLTVLVAALEGTLLMTLLVLAFPRFRRLVTDIRHSPYLLLCMAFVLIFAYGYSNIGNFGILTRQRVQVLPFFLVFLALPPRYVSSLRRTPHSRPVHHEELPR